MDGDERPGGHQVLSAVEGENEKQQRDGGKKMLKKKQTETFVSGATPRRDWGRKAGDV